jgi:ssRNA-specific RNase YbeY (16S rRNA maturation enzyme)
MTIEVLNESGHDLDMRRLARLGRFVMDRMRVHPLAELCIKAVDEPTIASLNEQWMEKEGPTDVLAFPMDELRPGLVHAEPEELREMFGLQDELLEEWRVSTSSTTDRTSSTTDSSTGSTTET